MDSLRRKNGSHLCLPRSRVDDLWGSPMAVGTMEEIIDDDHVIISTASGPESYMSIMSYVDKDLLEPGRQVLLHHKSQAIVGVLQDDADPLVSIMTLDKVPTESYADVSGLETQIQEIKVEHFFLYDHMRTQFILFVGIRKTTSHVS